jgi:2-oxo-4-hydroxy-4-carboxy--5-ureidoimidazoline (OHCU) decarboxylase
LPSKFVSLLRQRHSSGERFVSDHRLNGEDWQFDRQVFTVDQFKRVLSTERTIKSLTERGLIAYFIGQYDQDMQAIEKEAEDVLAQAPQAVQERVIIAIPRRGTRDLARVLLMKDTLSEKSTREKQEFGPALTELTKQFETQLDSGLQEVFDSCAIPVGSSIKSPG